MGAAICQCTPPKPPAGICKCTDPPTQNDSRSDERAHRKPPFEHLPLTIPKALTRRDSSSTTWCMSQSLGTDEFVRGGFESQPMFMDARKSLRTLAQERNLHPVVASAASFEQCIKLVRARKLFDMPVPWPRCQDLTNDYFKTPKQNDLVIAISHGWPYQAHPDALGMKIPEIRKVVEDAIQIHNPLGEALTFFDFCSVSQRPFLEGQSDRTEEEQASFNAALKIMPELYLLADGICHVDTDWRQVPGDGEIVLTDAIDLAKAELMKVGEYIQVSRPGNGKLRRFDIVQKVDGTLIGGATTVPNVEQKLKEARSANCRVEIRRSPMGIPNKIPASDRGWVYLERFVSMIKAAMVEDTEFQRICFSNCPKVLDDIRQGGERLRKAAQQGQESLHAELSAFFKELDQKVFGASSTDCLVGNVRKSFTQEGSQSGDRAIVKEVMLKLVQDLPSHWSKVSQRQRQRQLKLAVNRRDAQVVRELLVANANPNLQDAQGCAPLHVVAKYRDAEIARLLIEYDADVTLQDWLGNCPAHCLALFTNSDTIELFDILAPCEKVLLLANKAGVRVGKRFSTWSSTAQKCKPFEPAQLRVDALRSRFPKAFQRGPSCLTKMKPLETVFVIHEEITTIEIKGKDEFVPTWQSFGNDSSIHVVWIPILLLPWSVSKKTINAVAQELCNRHSVKIFVLTYCCVATPETAEEWGRNLLAAIERLPLNEKFVLIDGSILPCHLAWTLRTRLYATVCINMSFVYEEEFLTSNTWQIQKTDYGKRVNWYADKDIESVFNGTFPHLVYGGIGEEAYNIQGDFFKSCMRSETDQYWDHSKAIYQWLASGEAAALLNGFSALIDVPMWMLCSDNGPAAAMYEPLRVFRELYAPHSEICYIEDSKWWWELEGRFQHTAVATMLDKLLLSIEP